MRMMPPQHVHTWYEYCQKIQPACLSILSIYMHTRCWEHKSWYLPASICCCVSKSTFHVDLRLISAFSSHSLWIFRFSFYKIVFSTHHLIHRVLLSAMYDLLWFPEYIEELNFISARSDIHIENYCNEGSLESISINFQKKLCTLILFTTDIYPTPCGCFMHFSLQCIENESEEMQAIEWAANLWKSCRSDD